MWRPARQRSAGQRPVRPARGSHAKHKVRISRHGRPDLYVPPSGPHTDQSPYPAQEYGKLEQKLPGPYTATATVFGADAKAEPCTQDAVTALNSLQSNAATLEVMRNAPSRLSEYAIPEMIEYLERIGYKVRCNGAHYRRSSPLFVGLAVRSQYAQRRACHRHQGQRLYLRLRHLYPAPGKS